MRAVQLTQLASDNLPRKDMLTENALDPYVAVRNAYMQNRMYIIKQIQTDGAYNADGQVHEAQGATMLPSKKALQRKQQSKQPFKAPADAV